MGEKSQNTNLASEFYVLSMLYRMGLNAHMTLGNKKSVDIIIEKGNKLLTVDVKGLLDTSIFPMDNWDKKEKNHYLVFVTFLKHISNPNILPEVYIVPSLDIEKNRMLYKNPKGNRQGIQYSRLKQFAKKYTNGWDYFIK